ncbi:MAG: hypothetical protein COB20_07045 [SAR86 cluster bacterium]|uniref:Uncharacterized protein n=1 Tax=SAR86 cluster bacterium TaxID=2030880 RepID=A0A2A4X5P0_9GAMM|nr:MAG: hypothetical protein COB20_07045 [SAR86 cluster bacterium]
MEIDVGQNLLLGVVFLVHAKIANITIDIFSSKGLLTNRTFLMCFFVPIVPLFIAMSMTPNPDSENNVTFSASMVFGGLVLLAIAWFFVINAQLF